MLVNYVYMMCDTDLINIYVIESMEPIIATGSH